MPTRNSMPVMLMSALLAGCASVTSTPQATSSEGLAYFLPKQDFLITLTVTANGRTLTADSTTAYPDPGRRYLVKFSRNWVGKNDLDVGVTPSGLLTSAKSTTTSDLSDVLQNLAGAVGTFSLHGKEVTDPCATPGTYSKIVPADVRGPVAFCTMKIEIEPLVAIVSKPSTQAPPGGQASGDDSPADQTAADKPDIERANVARAGFYYRNALPYHVHVTDTVSKEGRSFLLFSPSQASTQFLPIARTVFANNEATLGFDQGMVKEYKQSADGELVALTKLPASILAAYFDAIGNAFGKRKGALDKEAEYLTALQAAELQRLKLEQCRSALATGDDAAIKVACGN